MVESYPWIYLLYNYTTSKLQPTDAILQRPLKQVFEREFNKWTTTVTSLQFDNEEVVKVDLGFANLKGHFPGWGFFFGLNHINNLQVIVEREWAKICLKLSTTTKNKEEDGEYKTLN